MNENRLKINAQKTELIFLGSRQLKKCETTDIKVTDKKWKEQRLPNTWVHGWMRT